MKTPTTKLEALDYLNSLKTDFELLQSGEWTPDDDSCEASLEVVGALMDFVEQLS